MRFPPEFIEKVRDATDIVDVLSQYTTFKNSGHNLMGLCPFPDHKEKTPSFSVSPTRQVYHCFGCKKGGNVINFLMDYNGMSFPETIEYLAQKASIPLPQNTGYKRSPQKESDTKTFLKLSLHAGRFFKERLMELDLEHPVWKYIEKRGLSKETLEIFKIGYSADEWSSFVDYLETIKAPFLPATQLGLIKQKKDGKDYFDIFRNRLMFPIFSAKGEVVGFGGRSLGDEQPKYLNSPESPIFHKGKILYGLNETAKYIRTEDQVIIVEGYMDLVMLYQNGFKNVVATLGTALTEDHARILKRYTNNVIVLFDSDTAGVQAQERSLPLLLAQGLLPKGISLTEAKDPDEYLKAFGVEKLKEKFSYAEDLFFTVLNRVFKDYRDTPTGKVTVLNRMSEYLLNVVNPALRDLYIQELALRLSVTAQWITRGLQDLKNHHIKPVQTPAPVTDSVRPSVPEEEQPKIRIQNPPKADIFLVNLALYKEEFLEEFINEGLESKLAPSGLDLVFKRIVSEFGQNRANFATLSSTLCSAVEDPSFILKHLDENLFAGTDVNKLKSDCLQVVRKRALDDQVKVFIKEMRQEQSPEKLEQFMNVIKDRQALKNLKN